MIRKYIALFFLLFVSTLLATSENGDVQGLTEHEMNLLDSAFFGDSKGVSTLISYGVNLNVVDEVGNTALILSAMMGHIDVVKLLLQANSKKDIKNKHGKTALNYAEESGYFEIANLLNES